MSNYYTTMLSLKTWAVLVIISFCSSFVLSETKHQFLAIPAAKQKISISSNLTINCSTNDANASTAVYYKRRWKQNTWKLLRPGVDQIVKVGKQVYALINSASEHRVQYQCRAWKGKNGDVISWPLNVGKVKIIPDKGKSEQISSPKKVTKLKSKAKLLPRKYGKKKRPKNKKRGNKRHGKKRHGSKRKGKKRPGSKKGVKKRRKGVKKSGKKKTTKIKKQKVHLKKKPDIQKPSIRLKTSKTKINAIVGRSLYINCAARYYPLNPKPVFTIAWYKDGKLLNQPLPSYLTITTKSKPQKRKVLSLLKIQKFQAVRDKAVYECKATYAKGQVASSLAVQVAPKT